MSSEERKQRLQMAVASNNLAAITSLISDTDKSVNELIGDVLGYMFYIYYMYVDNYHCKPYDLLDIADGILYLDIKGKQLEELRRSNERENRS